MEQGWHASSIQLSIHQRMQKAIAGLGNITIQKRAAEFRMPLDNGFKHSSTYLLDGNLERPIFF